jgi:uncharacterized membrane protein
MDDWLVLGLLAALVYAASGLAAKVALNKEYSGVDPASAGVFVSLGVFLVFVTYYFFSNENGVSQLTLGQSLISASIGFFWAVGSILVYMALKRNADISRMAPIYNMNTLIVVVLAVIFLRELPDKSQALRVVVGAFFIVVGGILVSI